MKESKNFLTIYAIVIIVLLVLILFILPDDFFSRKYNDNVEQLNEEINKAKEEQEKKETEKAKEFVDYKEQQNRILNGNFEYEYILMDSMGTKTYTFNCKGKKNGSIESGSCTTPTTFSYTEKDKNSKFKEKIDPTYIIEENIFNLINKVEPSLESHNLYREYTYETKIKDLDTTIIVQTTKDNISKVTVLNSYMTYMIKYSNVNIDN